MDADLRWALSTPWVAARLGIDPLRVERLRRAGELFAVRPAGCADWLYPSWQFDSTGRLRRAVASLLREAREQGIGAARVHELLTSARRPGRGDAAPRRPPRRRRGASPRRSPARGCRLEASSRVPGSDPRDPAPFARIRLVEGLAIVVPGASMRARGGCWTLSASCLACVAEAERIAAAGEVAAVVFTGYAPAGGATEAEQMRDAWRGPAGVELVLERTARTTAENAARTLPLLRERGIGAALVVCSRIHQARVRFFFGRLYREAGIETSFVAVRAGLSPRAVLWELAAAPVAWLQRRRVTMGRSDRGGAR